MRRGVRVAQGQPVLCPRGRALLCGKVNLTSILAGSLARTSTRPGGSPGSCNASRGGPADCFGGDHRGLLRRAQPSWVGAAPNEPPGDGHAAGASPWVRGKGAASSARPSSTSAPPVLLVDRGLLPAASAFPPRPRASAGALGPMSSPLADLPFVGSERSVAAGRSQAGLSVVASIQTRRQDVEERIARPGVPVPDHVQPSPRS